MKKTFLFLAMLLCMSIAGTQAQVTALSEDFESGIPSDWTLLDVDNDGSTWIHSSVQDPCYGGHNYSDGYMFSNDVASVDNWMIMPAIALGTDATLYFWRCVMLFQPAEHFGVYVSTTTTDISAFTLVYEETGVSSQNGWRERIVDISAYDGNTVYIAFRHFNSNAQILGLDDISITMNTTAPTIEASPAALDFGSVPMGMPTPSKELNVTTFNLTDNVTATVSGSFEISFDDSIFSTSVIIPDTGGTLYVRYFPMNVAADTGVLTLTSGTATLMVTVSGESVDCSDITLPYSQNFDDLPEYSLPTCWYQINPYLGYPMTSSSYAYSGYSMMFRCNGTTGEPVYLVLPEMPQNLSDLQISFWARRGGSSSGTFQLGYVTDPADGSTFVPIWSKTGSEMQNNSYYPFIIDFSDVETDPMLNYYIAFKYQTSNSAYWHMDNITVEMIPSCIAPTGLTVNSVGSNSANISWSGNAGSYVVFYKRTTDTAWTEIEDVILDTNGFVLTNLEPASNYTWYVASNCDDGTLINSLSTSTFQTECATILAPFTENFNAQNAIPNCWERLTGLASLAFSGINPTAYTGGWVMATIPFGNYHPKLNIWGVNTKSWLVTPPIDLSELDNPALTFDLALTKYNSADPILNPVTQGDDKFMVIISTDNGATWSAANATVWSDSASVGDYPYSQISTTGQEVSISLAAYANQTVKIAFYGESTVSGGDNDLHIDNVYVGEAPSCPKPTGLTVDSISHSIAMISWNDNTGVNSWTVEYKAEDEQTWDTLTVSSPDLILTGLTPITDYIVLVIANCGGGEFSQPTTITFTTHMTAQELPYSTDFAVTSDRNWVLNNGNRPNYWTFGTLGEESALFITNDGNTAGYAPNGAFSIVSAEKLFEIGDAAEVTISFNVKLGGESTFDYLKVFFAPEDASYPASNTFQTYADYDYDVNSIYFPISISPYPYMMNLTNGDTVEVTVNVPNPNANPTANSTAKLVFLWKNDQSSGTQPGAIVYNVSLEAVSCNAPVDLMVSNLTSTSADVSWTPTGGSDEWTLEYRVEGDNIWTSVSVSGFPTFALSGLIPGTTYEIRVQSVCGPEDQSLWTSATFTTPCETITTFPYTEDFENDGFMPDCWTQEYVFGAVNWAFQAGANSASGITSAHSGSYNAYFYHASNTGNTTRLVSPIFDLSNLTNAYITYWYAQKAWGNDQDHLVVYYRTSPNDEWQTLAQYHTSITSWTMDSLSLPTPSATYQIAFEGLANYGYGIVVDDITISGSAPVIVDPTVATTAASGISQTGAMLNGTIANPSGVTITEKGFEWKATAGGTYAPVTVTGNNLTYNLTGLTANTGYTYKAFITFNGTTVYGNEVTFTTLPEEVDPCETPTDLQQVIALKEAGGILVVWTDNAGVSEWNLQYRPLNGEWTTVVVTGQPSYSITGLVNGQEYEVRVQAVCDGGLVSEWSSILTATATNSGIENFLANSIALFPNPANEVVNVQCTMNNVEVESIEVFDVYGKLLQTVSMTPETTTINVSNLAAGMYFVRVTTEEGAVTKSFVKK